MKLLLSILCCCAWFGCSKPASEPVQPAAAQAKGPLAELQGSWVVAKATLNNKESRDRTLLEGQWKFQGQELLLEFPQKGTMRFALEPDVTATPKAFKATPVEPGKEGTGWMLFVRETNTLRIAFFDNLKGRPESFEPRQANAEPELVVVTLQPKE